jgi:hypothetical protein
MSTPARSRALQLALDALDDAVGDVLKPLDMSFLAKFCEAKLVATFVGGLNITKLEAGHIAALKKQVGAIGIFTTDEVGDVAKLFDDTGMRVWSTDGSQEVVVANRDDLVLGSLEVGLAGGQLARVGDLLGQLELNDATKSANKIVESWGSAVPETFSTSLKALKRRQAFAVYFHSGDADSGIARYVNDRNGAVVAIDSAAVLGALGQLKEAYAAA